MPEMPTSAFGALATTVPSASRTTMSRRRKEVRPFSSRSIWVPPTATVCLPPKFSSIAAFSHGVARSSSIGPLDSRHHRPAMATATTAKVSVAPQKQPPHQWPAQKPDHAAAQRVPLPAAGTVRRMMMTMMRTMARARRVAGWMPMIVVARCHALSGAPRPTHCAYSAAGREFVQRGPWHVSVEPLAPTRRNWHCRH